MVEFCMIAAIAVPVIAAVLCLKFGQQRQIDFVSNAATVLTLGLVMVPFVAFQNGTVGVVTLFEVIPGLGFELKIDGLGITFALLASGLWVLASWYTSGYADADHMKHRPRFFACFAASIGAAIGIAFSANVLTFLVFYELLTLATYPLVAHKEHDEAIGAGRRYLALSLGGGLLITAGAAWAWATTGTLDFVPGGFVGGHFSPAMIGPLFGLFMIGASVKAAVMPLHSWLPAAMVAPTPVSALLHAVAVVKAGVFGCMRVLGYVFGPDTLIGTPEVGVLVAFTAGTILLGSFIATRHDNLKRRLAFSTIVHLSYIVCAAAVMSPLGFTGSVLHMVNHGLCKITLFFVAGAIYATHHLENVSDMKGLAKKMPWTCGAFTVATLGLMGIPLLAGFVSKFFMIRGAAQASDWLALAIMLTGSVFTAVYLLPVVKTMFFDQPDPAAAHADAHHHDDDHDHSGGEANARMRYALCGTAVLVILFGCVPWIINVQYGVAHGVAESIFSEPQDTDAATAAEAGPGANARATGQERRSYVQIKPRHGFAESSQQILGGDCRETRHQQSRPRPRPKAAASMTGLGVDSLTQTPLPSPVDHPASPLAALAPTHDHGGAP